MMSNSYRQSVEYLYSLERHGIRPGLDTIKRLLVRLGHPQRRFASLHVGGTNGKGSAAVMTAAVLQASGYQVGLYTSPHLVDFRERIRVQGVLLPEERVVDLTNRIREASGATLSPTFFEFTTAMAFQFFAEEQVDIAVIEVGMGGRFDATNVLDPPAVLITNIAMDHENYLGHSLPAIAFEKAGIVKDGAPVVLGPVTGEPAQVIQSLATQKSATCYRFDSEFQVTHQFSNQFRYEGSYWSYEGLRCGLLGDHQVVNAACALALLEVASLQGLKVPESAVRLGLSQVVWEGRLEVMSQDPFVILDGAHNPAAADVLASSLVQLLRGLPKRRLILVVGMMQDKHHSGFLARLSPLADHVILTQSPILRSASVQMLQQALPHQGLSVQLVPDPLEALTVAREIATSSDLICITGSLILIGAVKASLLDCIPSLSQV